MTPTKQGRAVGYTRVSTAEQADSRAGLDAQEAAIRRECAHRGWNLVAIHTDAGASGGSMTKRPALEHALAALDAGEADTLVVAKLDRLSRSTLDFATLMERARAKGWGFAILDLGVDTTTASGEMMAGVVATFAQYERRLIGERTKAGLAAKRAQGVQLGRPRTVPEWVRQRVGELRERGDSWRAIASALNTEGVPTGQNGRQWYASSVRKLYLAEAPRRASTEHRSPTR
jgi:DNA invertase Pin-like site-specific DNA recombinase